MLKKERNRVNLHEQTASATVCLVPTEWSSSASPSGMSESGTHAVRTRSDAMPPLLLVLLLMARSVKESAEIKQTMRRNEIIPQKK